MISKYFAIITNGKISCLTDATPEHEIQSGQIALSYTEYMLLLKFESLESLLSSVDSLSTKLAHNGVQW